MYKAIKNKCPWDLHPHVPHVTQGRVWETDKEDSNTPPPKDYITPPGIIQYEKTVWHNFPVSRQFIAFRSTLARKLRGDSVRRVAG